MPRLSSQGWPSETLRRQSTRSSGSPSRETIPCAPRRSRSSVRSWLGSGVTTTRRRFGVCRIRSETASAGFCVRAASKIRMSAVNFLAAERVWDSVSDCPTTRISSSRAKILRSPARKMACVSATITRMNWPSTSCGWSTSISMLAEVLAIRFSLPFSPLALTALKTVFVDDYADATAAILFKIAHYAAAAVEPHIGIRSHYICGQRDGKVHHRTDGHFRIHVEKHAVGGNIFGLSDVCAGFRFHRNRQLDGKSHRALHVGIMPTRGFRRCGFAVHSFRGRQRRVFFPNFRAGTGIPALRKSPIVRHYVVQITPRNQSIKVTEVMELVGVKPCGSWN